jgi:glutamate-1-semialdehyde 2,1-aminomutase
MKTFDHAKSRELFMRAVKVIPGGVYGHLGPAEGCFMPVSAYPLFSSRAEGAYFWDVDGNRYLDYMCAYGPNILGYGDPEVDAAALAQLKEGNCVSSPSPKMIDLAELLVDTVKMADWAFFAKNGGDTTLFALMIARAATGRSKVVLTRGGYHGVQPWTQKDGHPGITPQDIANNLYVEFGDYEALERLFTENRGQIACFMATPYHHPVFEDNRLPPEGYWRKVRALCDREGVVLAIDDVRAGFRLDVAGSDAHYGFEADIECFCKALANGWNVSAVCGKDSLKEAAGSVMYTGSYWLSAVPIAAALACIGKLRRIDSARICTEKGRALTAGLVAAGKRHGYDLVVSGEPAMWFMRLAGDDSSEIHQAWVGECVRRGVFFANHHNLFINTAITDADIAFTIEVADDAFATIAKRGFVPGEKARS